MAQTKVAAPAEQSEQGIGRIIFASAAGTMIEWYDFYIFGSLAGVIASKFYTTGTPLGDLIAWLAAFAVGFIVRPFGALVFGRVGDLIGRKYTFLVTMTLMGVCTFLIGLMPTKAMIGDLAGILLIGLRILQGLALGGEYGGAATYVAEHAPHGKRGYYTSWIQITATAGFFISLIVILVTRSVTGEDFFGGKGAFANDYWQGWRIPFVLSAALVAISLWIRISLRESPLFAKLKHAGKTSVNPLKESFGNWYNLKFVLLALFGATMGQGVVVVHRSVLRSHHFAKRDEIAAGGLQPRGGHTVADCRSVVCGGGRSLGQIRTQALYDGGHVAGRAYVLPALPVHVSVPV